MNPTLRYAMRLTAISAVGAGIPSQSVVADRPASGPEITSTRVSKSGATEMIHVVDLPGRPVPWGGALALSPDGGRLVYSQLDGIDSDIMLVNNFR